jgi:hypothetical protein
VISGLQRDGFAVVQESLYGGRTPNEMYESYPSEYPFVSADLAFHTFMILVRAALDELEQLVLRAGPTSTRRRFRSMWMTLMET